MVSVTYTETKEKNILAHANLSITRKKIRRFVCGVRRYLESLKADKKRGPFDEKEEILLLQLVEKHGVGQLHLYTTY